MYVYIWAYGEGVGKKNARPQSNNRAAFPKRLYVGYGLRDKSLCRFPRKKNPESPLGFVWPPRETGEKENGHHGSREKPISDPKSVESLILILLLITHYYV